MKKCFYIITAFAFIIITSCKKEDNTTKHIVNSGYDIGGFIVNEGNFGTANASISFYNYQTDSVEQDIYMLNNNVPIGNTAQSITLTNDYIYIVVNASNKIEIVNRNTFKYITTIAELASPRFLKVVSSTKAYFTQWGNNGTVGVLNLSSNTISKTIDVGEGPEKMLFYNNLLYVANSGGYGQDSTISIINTNKDSITKTLVTAYNPIDMELDIDNNIWILCTGYIQYDPTTFAIIKETPSTLMRYNTSTKSIDKTIVISATEHPTILDISPDKQTLYYGGGMSTTGIYSISITATATPTAPLIKKSFYGFNIHPVSGEIYGLDAGDFASNGKMIKYSTTGSQIKEYTTGINPNSITFK